MAMTEVVTMEDVVAPLQECATKKKAKVKRPPLCTFFNHLGPGGPQKPSTTTTTTTTRQQQPEIDTKELVDPSTTTTSPSSDLMEGVLSTVVDGPAAEEERLSPTTTITTTAFEKETTAATTATAAMTMTTITTAAELVTLRDSDDKDNDSDDDTKSVETVNTSNKSVDLYLRDSPDRNAVQPAVDRWKEPPPPNQRVTNLADDLDGGLYITSRCESDSESETEESDKPSEIVFRKKRPRGRLQTRWKQQRKLKQQSPYTKLYY